MDKTYRHYPSLHEVRLLPGTPFYRGQQDMNEFLLAQDTGSMMYNFRKAAGLDTGGAAAMTGWDADDCKLKGHTTGHYMSGLALAYAATGDSRFRDKLSDVVSGLAECQAALGDSGRTAKGFLSAYDETQFDLLEQFTKYPEIWAPYYTLDKIMSGLLDAYELAGSDQALQILDPLGDWVADRLMRLDDETRDRMWSMYIAGEYGAMIVTMIRLSRITGKKKHLDAAKLFENEKLFSMMADGRDELDTMHANQHIPQIMGAAELFRETGDERYLRIARNFFSIVTEHHCYCIGGTGEKECFHEADSECGYLTESTAESCASYNMLRLASQLFEFADENSAAELMEYCERTLFNHILMSFSHRPDGGTTYFLPLAPGSRKHYETEENSCCHGTGMESRFRYMTQIFSYEDDDDILRVNMPVPSVLDGEERITVTSPDGQVIEIRADRDMKRRLSVRMPSWADKYSADLPAEYHIASGYLTLDRPLLRGEGVRISLPAELRKIEAASDPSFSYFARGPYIIAAVSGSDQYISADEILQKKRGIKLRPLYDIDGERYHIYFR